MTPLCNDQLTRVRWPVWASPNGWDTERVFRVGDKGDKNGMPYTVKAFGVLAHRIPGLPPLSQKHSRAVWLIVNYRGDRAHKWDCLLIGDTNSFQEKLVLGGWHPNPIFTHYHPLRAPQPL